MTTPREYYAHIRQNLDGTWEEQELNRHLEGVAKLNPLHAGMLLLISLALTLLGGWIPAIMASKKDPVEALRTE